MNQLGAQAMTPIGKIPESLGNTLAQTCDLLLECEQVLADINSKINGAGKSDEALEPAGPGIAGQSMRALTQAGRIRAALNQLSAFLG